MKYPQLLLLGDSITEYSAKWPSGLAPALATRYARRLDVINRGYSGYNSRTIRIALPHILSSVDTELAGCILFLGTNDAALSHTPQHVPMLEFRENMAYILDAVSQRTSRILLLTPAIADEKQWPEHSNVQTQPYIDAVEELARERDLPFVNLRKLFQNNLKLLDDGLHFTNDGYSVFMPSVFEKLSNLGLDPAALTIKLPYWRDLSLNDGEALKQIEEYIERKG